eukprot:145688-Pleurochrysis_carterae.AAC.1
MLPATWWSASGKALQKLAKTVQTVLAQPDSTSAAEHNWSVYYGHIKSMIRMHFSSPIVYCPPPTARLPPFGATTTMRRRRGGGGRKLSRPCQ